jgi:hypothetical protein
MKKFLLTCFRRSSQGKDISLENARSFFSEYDVDLTKSEFPDINSNSNWFRNLDSRKIRNTPNTPQTIISGQYYLQQTNPIRYDFTMTDGKLKIDKVSLENK